MCNARIYKIEYDTTLHTYIHYTKSIISLFPYVFVAVLHRIVTMQTIVIIHVDTYICMNISKVS